MGIPDLYKYHHFEATKTPGLLLIKQLSNQPATEFRFTADRSCLTAQQLVLNTIGGGSNYWWPFELGLPPAAPRRIPAPLSARRGRPRQDRRRRIR